MSWRDQKSAARQAVHSTFTVPVRCRLRDLSVVAANVRIHTKATQTGNLESEGYAERHEIDPRLVFLVADFEAIDDCKKLVVVTEDNEAYVIDTVLPKDGLTITCMCTRISDNQFNVNGLKSHLPYGGLTVPA
jgi:hypothetical protein